MSEALIFLERSDKPEGSQGSGAVASPGLERPPISNLDRLSPIC